MRGTARAWLVYILECADGTLYTGVTLNLSRRLTAHERGAASKYTRARLPVRLAWLEPRHSRSSALRREVSIKRMPRKEKLRLVASSRAPLRGLP